MTAEHFQHIQSLREEFQSFIETIFGGRSLMLTPFLSGEPDARDMYRSEYDTAVTGQRSHYEDLHDYIGLLLETERNSLGACALRFRAPLPDSQKSFFLVRRYFMPSSDTLLTVH